MAFLRRSHVASDLRMCFNIRKARDRSLLSALGVKKAVVRRKGSHTKFVDMAVLLLSALSPSRAKASQQSRKAFESTMTASRHSAIRRDSISQVLHHLRLLVVSFFYVGDHQFKTNKLPIEHAHGAKWTLVLPSDTMPMTGRPNHHCRAGLHIDRHMKSVLGAFINVCLKNLISSYISFSMTYTPPRPLSCL